MMALELAKGTRKMGSKGLCGTKKSDLLHTLRWPGILQGHRKTGKHLCASPSSQE